MKTPLDNNFLLEAAEISEEELALPVPELSPRYAYKPLAPPKPLLPHTPELCYEAPQPERLAAILAAPAPLIAAAQPLLDVLANIPQALDAGRLPPFIMV